MMPTPEEVQALLNVEFSPVALQGAIEDAAMMLGPCAVAYDGPRQKTIIKYLAAHLLASSPAGQRGNVKSESIDGVSYSFGGATLGSGLNGTTFGQQALQFDIDGCLAQDKVQIWSL